MTCRSSTSGLREMRSRRNGQPLRMSVLALMTAGALVLGCGRSAGSVAQLKGEVTLDGQPLPNDAKAFVVFVPDKDPTKRVSVPVSNGRYDSPHTPLGAVTVHFEVTREVGPTKTSERTGQPYRDIENLVPAKYATGMSLDVKGDDPNHDFDLND